MIFGSWMANGGRSLTKWSLSEQRTMPQFAFWPSLTQHLLAKGATMLVC